MRSVSGTVKFNMPKWGIKFPDILNMLGDENFRKLDSPEFPYASVDPDYQRSLIGMGKCFSFARGLSRFLKEKGVDCQLEAIWFARETSILEDWERENFDLSDFLKWLPHESRILQDGKNRSFNASNFDPQKGIIHAYVRVMLPHLGGDSVAIDANGVCYIEKLMEECRNESHPDCWVNRISESDEVFAEMDTEWSQEAEDAVYDWLKNTSVQ